MTLFKIGNESYHMNMQYTTVNVRYIVLYYYHCLSMKHSPMHHVTLWCGRYYKLYEWSYYIPSPSKHKVEDKADS